MALVLAVVGWLQPAHAQMPRGQAPVAVADVDELPLSPTAWVLEDVSGTLTFAEVLTPEQQARFRPAAGKAAPTHFGVTTSAYWLRMQVGSAVALPPRTPLVAHNMWLFEVGFPLLDEVDFLELKADGTVTEIRTGDMRPFSQRPLPHRNFVFPLQLNPGQERTVYLRVRSTSTVSIPVTLWKPSAFWVHDNLRYALVSLYFGVLLGLFLYNLFIFLFTRESRFLWYVLFSLAMAAGQLGLTGVGAVLVWPEHVWVGSWLPRAGLAASAWLATLFVRSFLETREHFPRLDRGLAVLGGFAALCVASVLLAPAHASALMVNVLSLTVGVCTFAVGVYAWWQRAAGAQFFLLAWTALLAGAAVLPLHNLGWLPINVFTRNALLLGSALEMLLLSIALADRFNAARRDKEEAQAQAIAAERDRVLTLQTSERELESRVLARTLELEAANQSLRANEQLLERQAHHDPLTGLANRALLTAQIRQAMARAQRSGQGFALVVLDLDGFKAINDNHGHAAGDLVLQAVAQRLNTHTRAVDTVARVGGDEFVLLLEGVDGVQPLAALEALLATALEQPVTLPCGAQVDVGVSLGHARYPMQAQDMDQLLQLADQAMYQTKAKRRAARLSVLMGRVRELGTVGAASVGGQGDDNAN